MMFEHVQDHSSKATFSRGIPPATSTEGKRPESDKNKKAHKPKFVSFSDESW
jgi:hypothetical protein